MEYLVAVGWSVWSGSTEEDWPHIEPVTVEAAEPTEAMELAAKKIWRRIRAEEHARLGDVYVVACDGTLAAMVSAEMNDGTRQDWFAHERKSSLTYRDNEEGGA